MKTLKFLATVALCFLSVGFVSCGDDNDEPEPVVEPTPDPTPKPDDQPFLTRTFKGTTTTNMTMMGGPSQEYSTQLSKWNFVISADKKKCTVTIIDAKFASMMPSMTLMIPDIPYDSEKGEINGTEIIPSMLEVGEWTPAPRFIFTSISGHIDAENPTSATVYYEVKSMGNGTFVSDGIVEE